MATKKKSSRVRTTAHQLPEVAHRSTPWPLIASLALVIAAGVWAYSTSFQGVFVLDDVRAIARNASIRTLTPVSTPLSPPSGSTVAGRPVANLSFAINYALAPADARETFSRTGPAGAAATAALLENAWGYHLANLLVHLTCALLIFGIVRRTLLSAPLRERFGTSAAYLALITSLVWVVHPLTTESVTYIVQRVESLMGMFYLLTLYCAIRADGGSRSVAWTVAAATSCAIGMATKEVMVTAPVVVLLWDLLFRAERRPRWGVVSALCLSWVIFGALLSSELRTPSIAFDQATAWRYLLTQSEVLMHYLGLAFVPAPLVFLYDWPLADSIAAVWPRALMLVALLGLTIAGLLHRHPLAFAGACFFVILAPTSSVIPIITEIAAEHRMYLPLAAVVAAVVACIYATGARVLERVNLSAAARRIAVGIAVIATLVTTVAYGLVTRERNRDYWSEEALWRHTVANEPRGQRARVAYGTALAAERKLAEAEVQFRAAIAINDQDPIALTRLGSVVAAQDRIDEARPLLERAVAIRPDDVDAHRFLGQIYLMRDDTVRAIRHLDESVRLTSRRDAVMLHMLSTAQAAAGRMADARSTAHEAQAIAMSQGNAGLVSTIERHLRALDQR